MLKRFADFSAAEVEEKRAILRDLEEDPDWVVTPAALNMTKKSAPNFYGCTIHKLTINNQMNK